VSLRCGGDDAPNARLLRLKAPGGAVLTAFDVGRGATAAVFLHQTTGGGFCGWWPYGSWLAESGGVRAVGLDLCGYGTSRCSEALQDDPVRQVKVVVDWLRGHGADRVVVVGASLGGSVALDAAAALDVDAVVDLSGPVDYPTTRTTRSLPRLRVPTLIAVSRSDDPSTHDVLQRAMPRIPARTKRFVSADGGHGYALVWGVQAGVMAPTPFATTVADWVRGHYTT
jgi:pimeloyl-ACP methyl ester carboxylesterase